MTSDARPRICPECGSDKYFARTFTEHNLKLHELQRKFRSVCAAHGADRATWEIRLLEFEGQHSSLTRKVNAQRKVINRLENKLLALRHQPYKEESEEGGKET